MKTKNPMNPMKNFSTFGRVMNVLPFKLNIMKKWMLFLTLFLSIFYACDQGEKKGKWKMQNTDVNLQGCIYCDNLGNHEIPFSEVHRLISAFHNDETFRSFNIGGVFDHESLQKAALTFKSETKEATSPTSIFYPAIDNRGIFEKRLYIAYEIKDCGRQNEGCLDYFNNPTLKVVRPNHFTGISRFEDDEISTIDNLKIAISAQTTKEKPSFFEEDLLEHRNNFYREYSNYYSPGAIAYDKRLVNDALGTLGGNNNKTTGYRYYWGIDATQGDYKLRVIFCAVNAEGKIIVPDGNWDIAFRESSRPRRP